MQFVKLIVVVCCLTFAQFSFGGVKETIAKSIVRVRSGNKISTGFFWKDGSTVLTTLHSLSGVNNTEVFIPKINDWRKTTLKKVLKNGDMILLSVADYSSPNFLSDRYNNFPTLDTKVFTIGYNSGNISYIDKDFQVGLLQGNTLKDLLPLASQQEIKSLGFPSLSIPIIYLKGNLLHGFSGAPIVDTEGKLVGIADGGLENGAAGISWCISSNLIGSLETSQEEAPFLNVSKINTLFAAEEYTDKTDHDVQQLQLNEFTFKKIKTRTFSQLDLTGKYSDADATGLQQLLATFSMYNCSAFVYDIYLEEKSGATIVLPADYELKEDGNLITAGTEKIKFYLNIVKTPNAQQASLTFEGAIMPFYNTNWMSDPMWSYLTPYPGPNNSLIRRRAYYGNSNTNYLFEALAGNGKYFLGVAAKRNNLLMTTYDIEEWAKCAIAIQLTSFTN